MAWQAMPGNPTAVMKSHHHLRHVGPWKISRCSPALSAHGQVFETWGRTGRNPIPTRPIQPAAASTAAPCITRPDRAGDVVGPGSSESHGVSAPLQCCHHLKPAACVMCATGASGVWTSALQLSLSPPITPLPHSFLLLLG
jgi:hypothetical protein